MCGTWGFEWLVPASKCWGYFLLNMKTGEQKAEMSSQGDGHKEKKPRLGLFLGDGMCRHWQPWQRGENMSKLVGYAELRRL